MLQKACSNILYASIKGGVYQQMKSLVPHTADVKVDVRWRPCERERARDGVH